MQIMATEKTKWLIYICKACGLLYKEEEGDPDSGLAPGTLFADIPEDWMCPLCGVTKADFVLQETNYQINSGLSPVANNFYSISTSQSARTRFSDVLIIGAGKAGWEAAQALRQLHDSLSITIVTGCSGDVYEKPQLSVAIQKKIDLERLVREKGLDAANRLNMGLFNHTHAVHINPNLKQVRTTKGVFKYSNLIIAHGAKPFRHPLLNAQDCWHVNHLSTYRELRLAIEKKKSQIAIIGAGLIGCELANDLALNGHQITLLDSAHRPLSQLIPEAASEALMRSWEKLPIQFLGTQDITEMSTKNHQKILKMASGVQLTIDQIVICMGLQPDYSLSKSAGIKWDQGIAVDPQSLITSVNHIYALGDCISIGGKTSRYIEPIIRQAEVIAQQITGNHSFVFNQQPCPIRIKTSSLPMRLEGLIQQQGVWKFNNQDQNINSQKWQMTQWNNNQAGAQIEIG